MLLRPANKTAASTYWCHPWEGRGFSKNLECWCTVPARLQNLDYLYNTCICHTNFPLKKYLNCGSFSACFFKNTPNFQIFDTSVCNVNVHQQAATCRYSTRWWVPPLQMLPTILSMISSDVNVHFTRWWVMPSNRTCIYAD